MRRRSFLWEKDSQPASQLCVASKSRRASPALEPGPDEEKERAWLAPFTLVKRATLVPPVPCKWALIRAFGIAPVNNTASTRDVKGDVKEDQVPSPQNAPFGLFSQF